MSGTAWAIIISVFVTVVVGWLSTRSTNKRLNTTMHILAGLIEGSIKGNQVSVRKNKRGQLIGLRLGVNEHVGISENIIAILKKANEADSKETSVPPEVKK
jgi:hypothetical protein